jgi:uncharacterized protein (DUF2461 family)
MTYDFPNCAATFISKLSRNIKIIENHRDEYKTMLLEPAHEFVIEMGSKLQTIRPNIIAIPKIDKSIFRLHRDVRFSKDKLPYKKILELSFGKVTIKAREFVILFSYRTKIFFLGGELTFTDDMIKAYRECFIR